MNPLAKLTIKSEADAERTNFGTLSRIEERGSVLILQAPPVDLQSEVVSTRALSCVALMFLIFTRYQPGGGGEKATILAYLTQPVVEGSANLMNCHQALRKWEKLYRRCRESSLRVPDPVLLVRALDTQAW